MNLSKAPMGWNSWDCYGASVDEETVRKNADYMAKHLKQYGWGIHCGGHSVERAKRLQP